MPDGEWPSADTESSALQDIMQNLAGIQGAGGGGGEEEPCLYTTHRWWTWNANARQPRGLRAWGHGFDDNHPIDESDREQRAAAHAQTGHY